MECPQCSAQMTTSQRGGATVAQCSNCGGIFLARVDLGLLIEQENEWHLGSGPITQPIPRIVPGMDPPSEYAVSRKARAYIDELFGQDEPARS